MKRVFVFMLEKSLMKTVAYITIEERIRDCLNWYVYANNNPLVYVDSTWLLSLSDIGDAVVKGINDLGTKACLWVSSEENLLKENELKSCLSCFYGARISKCRRRFGSTCLW
ncbi:MAG: hypothetical protein PQJ46_09160 [Spirochaetales bacterium]|nr:hypothetical protein [Spirochaetales bacterium]